MKFILVDLVEESVQLKHSLNFHTHTHTHTHHTVKETTKQISEIEL